MFTVNIYIHTANFLNWAFILFITIIIIIISSSSTSMIFMYVERKKKIFKLVVNYL